MNVSLNPKLQKFVEDQVKAGHFPTTDKVLEAGVAHLMLDPEPLELDEETMDAIDRAEAEFDRGEGIPADEVFARLRRKHFGV